MIKKILIVGGSGFIGYHLAKNSLKKGWKVTSISLNKPPEKRFLKKVNYIICDITSKKFLNRKINGTFDFVVNLGGHVNHTEKIKTYKSHYLGCKNLAEIFLKKKIDSFIQLGSGGEYGKISSPHKESDSGSPKATYAKAKLLATKYLVNLHKINRFPCTILRLYQAYGPKQDTNRFLPVLITNCLKNKKFQTSSGNQYRDFIHVNDLVKAIFKAIKNKKTKGQIINIGSGKPLKIKKIIFKVMNLCKGGKPEFGKIKLRKDENLKTYPNTLKSKRLLSWQPVISFDKGLKETIRSYDKK